MMVGRDRRAHSLGAFPALPGLARMERANSRNQSELESRASSLST
jgi:hypothetical protein